MVISGKFRIGDIRHNIADLTKAKQLLGFEPKVGFAKGILEFVEWVKKQEVQKDKYDESIKELKDKGLMR